MTHFISRGTAGERCGYRLWPNQACGRPATHKVEEFIPNDEPTMQPGAKLPFFRHPFTQYVCCEHFRRVMGPAVSCPGPGGLAKVLGAFPDMPAQPELSIPTWLTRVPGWKTDLPLMIENDKRSVLACACRGSHESKCPYAETNA